MSSYLQQIPVAAWMVFSAGFLLLVGFLIARKIWGKNSKRLQTALDDSSYLANQWATLGISQSQLVEKLGSAISDAEADFDMQVADLKALCRERELAVETLEKEVGLIENSRSQISEREVETLQMQVGEIQKRDARIRTLEARLKYLDQQNEQTVEENRKQTKVLLERIAVLEETGGGPPDPEIEKNNRQLTELLKKRCGELETLRDGFYAKEKAFKALNQAGRF